MIRILFLTVSFVVVLSFSFQGLIVAQTMEQEISPPESPADFPDFIVAPRKDLKPFTLSTISTSTLGKPAKGISNLEVNQLREKETKERVFGDDTALQDVEPHKINFFPLPSNTKGKFFKWVDKNGVIHVTNDPDSIP